ncbi:hypothetical protein [Cellulosimicrobium marinum]|uniref:hypothetical protein n=1 Tax=Cellulosimicrobium marinum TaxID=1638992 RepID=UPI001E2E3371|nr:hypothetical protein [Cellulosimicrobium marinum]MCB7137436.1 hypothetical protein [Cellulosimicrobium marinum]
MRLHAPPGTRRHARTATAVTTALALTVTGLAAAVPAASAPAPASPSATAALPADLPELRFDDPSINWKEILVDGEDVERRADGTPYNVFGGFGSVSCNNTGNLLLDYKEENPEAYWRIMHLIFDPETGAGLKHIKVEMGSDTNTSSGTEPATKRSADEPANVLRGAGFHFIADALSINPDIETEALRWGEPSWTQTDPELRYQWYKETIDAAYDTYGVEFDYMSPSQNEVGGSFHQASIAPELAWTVEFAERLEADAEADDARYDYGDIKIVALDTYRNVEPVAAAILGSPAALEQIDAIGYHYDIAGGPNLTRLNKEYGMEVLYSEGVAPMIDPEYRVEADPERGGIGGTVGAVDIADRFINAYRWSGAGANPAHMTSFLFQPAVSAMYEGTQYSPKHLVRASDPWSGYYEGGVGVATVRHFHQFAESGWEYVEGATYGDGTKGDGGTNVDTSTRTYMTLRTPAAEGGEPDVTQVHANNTRTARHFEVKVANLGEPRPLTVWETRGPDAGEEYDANWLRPTGYVEPVRTETVDGTEYAVYQVEIAPYSIQTLSTLPQGVHGTTEAYDRADYASPAQDTALELPYTDDFEYADYPTTEINGVEMGYVERRGGSPRYTADQNGAFEVVEGDGERGNVMVQQIHADNRGYTWDVWGSHEQDRVSTAPPATVLGDHAWANYTASVDFRLDTQVRDASLENFAGLGVRQHVPAGQDLATYTARVHADGTWQLRKLNTVVSSGTVAGFDADAWHALSVEARDNVITVTLDDAPLTRYVDASRNPMMTGRISIVSGYYNTQYDDLAVTPIEDQAWESVKIDDADARISYPGGFSFNQSGYAHLNRTQHVLTTGRSAVFEVDGTGFNLFGASAAATIDVAVNDQPVRTVDVGSTGDRQTSYWQRGLDGSTPHTVTVTVRSGTFTLDGVDVLVGGAPPVVTDPETTPVTVAEPVARLATSVGQAPELPDTVRATSQAGTTIDAPVEWFVPAGAFDTPYATTTLTGTFTDNEALAVTAQVEVVPDGVQYFVDANAPATPAAVAHPAVKAFVAAQGGTLRNAQADALWSEAAGWGRAASYSAKGLLNQTPYDKMRETGWYTAGASTPLVYRFTLPAGTYTVSSGHTEWWNVGNGRARNLQTSVSWTGSDGQAVSVPVGKVAFPNGSSGRSEVLSGELTLTEETVVSYTVANDGGTEAPVISWVAIAGDEAEQGVATTAVVEQRCLAGKPYLAVRVTNDDEAALDLEVATAYGTKTFEDVAPGKNAYQAFVVRGTPAEGVVTVTARAEGRESVEEIAHAAPTC